MVRSFSSSALFRADSEVIVLMADPNWKRGFYYDDMPPHTGMKLARRASLLLILVDTCTHNRV